MDTTENGQSRKLLWAGRAVSALPVLMLVMSASMKLTHRADFVRTWVGELGFREGALTGIGLLELACAAIYVIPQTALLGAVLLTAYLGGATASHVRVGQSFAAPVVVGVLVWVGLLLRDARLRALAPMRRTA